MERRNGLIWLSSSFSSTPAWMADSYASSSKMSQPVKTKSLRPASGTNLLILGDRPSVRLPNRLRDTVTHGFNAGHERGRDRAHARNHYAQLASGGSDLGCMCRFGRR